MMDALGHTPAYLIMRPLSEITLRLAPPPQCPRAGSFRRINNPITTFAEMHCRVRCSGAASDDVLVHTSSPPPAPPSTDLLSQPLFDTMCDKLANWHHLYYTTIVPRSAHDARELAEWVSALRRLKRKGSLPPWVEARLLPLGMVWDVDGVTAKWHSNFHLAREFKEAHGGEACDVNVSFTPKYENEERADWVEASRWLDRQRELYRSQKLTDLRVALLKGVLGESFMRVTRYFLEFLSGE